MIRRIRRFYQKKVPLKVRMGIRNNVLRHFEAIYSSHNRNKYRKQIIKYCESLPDDEEKKEVAEYLRNNKLTEYPYHFPEKYVDIEVEAKIDADGYPYLYHEGKKLYGKKSMGKNKFVHYYKCICAEQDPESPHCYFTCKKRLPDESDIVADLGVAEGNFSLEIIDKVKKIYLFEADEEWIEPLKRTFEPWKDKVVIINKFVSNKTDENNIQLDDFFKENEKATVIKADIEGSEMDMLDGAKESLNYVKKLFICAYHRKDDEKLIGEFMEKYNCDKQINSRYMIFLWEHPYCKMEFPFLRRGLMFFERQNR